MMDDQEAFLRKMKGEVNEVHHELDKGRQEIQKKIQADEGKESVMKKELYS